MLAIVTGARGFIGRYVSLRFSRSGYKVVGLGHGAWLPHEYSAWGLSDWLNGDVAQANLDILASLHGLPAVIVHLAGGSSVGPSFVAPAEDYRRSVGAVSEVVEWIRLRSASARLVMASSAAVYGAGHAGRISEECFCSPYSPYGYHKRMAELIVESYSRNFNLNSSIVRLFSVYGNELRKQLLWDACVKLQSGEKVLRLGGSGNELRDWLHVHDAAEIFFNAVDIASPRSQYVNGGTGVATSVREIAEVLAEAWGGGSH